MQRVKINFDIRAELFADDEETDDEIDDRIDKFIEVIKRRLPNHAKINEVDCEVTKE